MLRCVPVKTECDGGSSGMICECCGLFLLYKGHYDAVKGEKGEAVVEVGQSVRVYFIE